MILNEDYFEDLEITDEDIIEDDINNVEEPEPNHDLTVEEAKKLPEQYSHLIRFRIDVVYDRNRTFIQTTLLPKLFKRLDVIFEMYGIEHYEYILATMYDVKMCDTVVKFGNYQLFCVEDQKDIFINGKYNFFFIHVFVNYPEFTYKRAFRFVYTMLNLYKYSKLISRMIFKPLTDDYIIQLYFVAENDHIIFYYYKKTYASGDVINLSKELTEENKREFYYSVFYHFFGEGVRVPYKLIDKDVPIKSIELP